jgi:hypothetical protein
MAGYGRCPVFLLAVALSSGGNASNITVKASHWGDYFIYDTNIKNWRSFSTQIIIGDHSSTDNSTSMGIGTRAGLLVQSPSAIAIGHSAGNANQGDNAIAIGKSAGQVSQSGIAIGTNAGQNNQLQYAIAIGLNAGQIGQQLDAIAIGTNAGQIGQLDAIAIGTNAGQTGQQSGAIAIGTNAGQLNQHSNSIVIGYNASSSFQSIVLSSATIPFNPGATGVFIRPLRGPNLGTNLLSWNTTTKEIFYNGSSERYKYDIQPLLSESDSKSLSLSIDKLQPREFKYKLGGTSDIGLIAEEAYQCNPAFAYLDKTQLPEGIEWNAITVSLVKELQQMKTRIATLKQIIC